MNDLELSASHSPLDILEDVRDRGKGLVSMNRGPPIDF